VSIAPVATNPTASTSQVHGHHEHGGHRVAMDAAAQVLGMTHKELRAALSGGQTIASLATGKGISADTMKAAITDALTKANPNLTADRAAQLAARFLDGPRNSGGAPRSGDVDHDGDSR